MERKFGPYTLVRQIAVGGMAEIYLARTEGIAGFEKYVAIKMIHQNFSDDKGFVQMLIDEAKITVQLAHVNIAQTFDLGRVGDCYYITMEYVEGCDLYHLLREGSELDIDVPIDVASYIVKEAATGLDYAHRKRDVMGMPLKIVHRDVSPQNVLVSTMGEVKIIDFGIAKATVVEQRTQAGVIKGKYYYMSPEQAWGEHLDSRTDIFSIGIILYELLTGQMLYLEEDLSVLLERIREANIEKPTSLRRDIPPELEQIVMKALKKRPNERYSTGAELAEDLEKFLGRHSPGCGAHTITSWTEKVLGESVEQSADHKDSLLDERDLRAATQGLESDQLLNTDDDFTDGNSVIFRIGDIDKKIRAAKAQEAPQGERDINQETGVVEASPMDSDPFARAHQGDFSGMEREISDRTKLAAAPDPFVETEEPSVETEESSVENLYSDDDGEHTVVSGPPGFGGIPSPPKLGAPPSLGAPPTYPKSSDRASSPLGLDYNQEQTLKHNTASKLATTPSSRGVSAAPAKQPLGAAGAIPKRRTHSAAAKPGPWNKSNALNTANPEPAISALKPAKKSRRTPAQGVSVREIASKPSPSVLSNIIGNSSNRAQVALSQPPQMAYGGAAPVSPTILGQVPAQVPAPVDMGFPPRAASPHTHPGASPLVEFPTSVESYEVDELPDAYKLKRGSEKTKLVLVILGFVLLALAAAAAGYKLITHKNAASSPSATVMIVSSPDGARVLINGSVLSAKTPTSYSNSKVGDTVKITIDLEGHKPWKKEVTLSTRDDKIVARLEPILVNLTVISVPPGADIYLNGSTKVAGRTPRSFKDITPSSASTIVLKKSGFKDVKRSLDWADMASKEENFKLTK